MHWPLFSVIALFGAPASALSSPNPRPDPPYVTPGPWLCTTDVLRAEASTVVQLRSSRMPDLPESGVWIEPGETICLIASPERSAAAAAQEREHVGPDGQPAAELVHLTVPLSTNAASLVMRLKRGESQQRLWIGNPSPQRIGFVTQLTTRHWLDPGQELTLDLPGSETGALLSHFLRQDAPYISEEKWREEQQKQRWLSRNPSSFSLAPLVYSQISNLDRLYQTLDPLGYERPDNTWLAWGFLFSASNGPFFFTVDWANSSRKMHPSGASKLRAVHGAYGLRFGFAPAISRRLRVIPLVGLSSEYYRLKFDDDAATSPAWMRGNPKPSYARLIGAAGIMTEVMLGSSPFLRTEVGGRFLLGKGRWRIPVPTRDRNGDGEPESKQTRIDGPPLGSNSPYLMMIVGFRLGSF